MGKSFKINNPAMQYISGGEEVERSQSASTVARETEPAPAPQPVKESKSRRLQLLIRPSVYQAILSAAQARGESFNNMMDIILQDYIDREGL